jgi:outer membrane protein assembly factor BamB
LDHKNFYYGGFKKMKVMKIFNRLSFIILIGVILVISANTCYSAGLADTPWPKYHHDSKNTGQSSLLGPKTSSVLWTSSAQKSISSSPAIAKDGTLYYGSDDHKLYAVSSNGKIKWTYTTGGAIRSSPAIGSDGTIYFGSWDGYLYALKSNKSLKWKFKTGMMISSSPAIGSDGTIYIGDKSLYAINPVNGLPKWTANDIRAGLVSSPAIGKDGTIYVGSGDGKLYAVNPSNGKIKWSSASFQIITAPAIGSNGIIYIGSWDHYLYAINPLNGSTSWKFKTNDVIWSSPSIGSNGTIYVGSWDKTIYAINPVTKKKLWSLTTQNKIYSSPTLGKDGNIYFGNGDGYLYALSSAGKLLWKYKLPGMTTTSPVIGINRTLYVASLSKLYAFQDLYVKSVVPANKSTNVSIDTSIKATFNKNIKASISYKYIGLKSSTGTIIPIKKSIYGNVLVIKPLRTLKANTYYYLTLPTKCVKDISGINLSTVFKSIFKTKK